MIQSRTSPPGTRGFTLLEILIAVVAFAIVLAAINSVFYGALRLRNKTTEMLEAALPLQQTIAIIKRDLLNLVSPGGTLAGELQTTPTDGLNTMRLATRGQPVGPEFYTAAGVMDETTPWADVERVSYLLADPTNSVVGRDLVRAVTRNLLPTVEDLPVQQWLMSGVQNVVFSYFDGTRWSDSWDSTTQEPVLPCAIKVQIELAVERGQRALPPIEIVVPVMVEASTNQTAQAEGEAQ